MVRTIEIIASSAGADVFVYEDEGASRPFGFMNEVGPWFMCAGECVGNMMARILY